MFIMNNILFIVNADASVGQPVVDARGPRLEHEAKPFLDQGAHGPPGSACMKSGAYLWPVVMSRMAPQSETT